MSDYEVARKLYGLLKRDERSRQSEGAARTFTDEYAEKWDWARRPRRSRFAPRDLDQAVQWANLARHHLRLGRRRQP